MKEDIRFKLGRVQREFLEFLEVDDFSSALKLIEKDYTVRGTEDFPIPFLQHLLVDFLHTITTYMYSLEDGKEFYHYHILQQRAFTLLRLIIPTLYG